MYEDVTEYSVRYFVHLDSMYGVDLELIWSRGQCSMSWQYLVIHPQPQLTLAVGIGHRRCLQHRFTEQSSIAKNKTL
jgi:hypothetical protein